MYVIEVKCVDHLSNNTDDYGHNVPKLQPYLLCSYLEKLNGNKKVLHIEEVKKCFPLQRKYPVSTCWVWTKLQQKRFIFSSNNKFIEVLSCVQFTSMDSLF